MPVSKTDRLSSQILSVAGIALCVLAFMFFRVEQQTGMLVVNVTPAGATVKVTSPASLASAFKPQRAADGQAVFEIKSAGRYVEVVGFAKSYDPVTKRVFMPADGSTVTTTINLTAETGLLTIRTEPAGANVFFDGKASGISPMLINQVAPGKHLIKAVKRGYEDAEQTITMSPGQSLSLELVLPYLGGDKEGDEAAGKNIADDAETLPAGFGRLTLVSSHSATFFVDNQAIGMGKRVVRNLPAGPHVVLCRVNKRGQKSKHVEVIEKTNHIVEFDFPEDPVDKAKRATDPSEALYWVIKGGSTRNSGRWGDAVDMFKTALEIEPDNIGAHRQLAFTLPSMKALGPDRWDDAIFHMEKYLELHPDAPDRDFAKDTLLLFYQKKEEGL